MKKIFLTASLRITALVIAFDILDAIEQFSKIFVTEVVLNCYCITNNLMEKRIDEDDSILIIHNSKIIDNKRLICMAVNCLMENDNE